MDGHSGRRLAIVDSGTQTLESQNLETRLWNLDSGHKQANVNWRALTMKRKLYRALYIWIITQCLLLHTELRSQRTLVKTRCCASIRFSGTYVHNEHKRRIES